MAALLLGCKSKIFEAYLPTEHPWRARRPERRRWLVGRLFGASSPSLKKSRKLSLMVRRRAGGFIELITESSVNE